MINDLDLTLKELLTREAQAGGVLEQAEISFSVPDEEWRSSTGTDLNLNVYLYDIRENLELRSNQRQMEYNALGQVTQIFAPPRIDCAYIITAWDKSPVSGDDDKELLEHRLLSEVLYVLLSNPKIPEIYLQASLTNQQPKLPMVSAQKGGLPEPVEFWNALGSPLKPSINCVITISLPPAKTETAARVKSMTMEKQQQDEPDSAEVSVRVVGRVFSASHPAKGIKDAVVDIDELNLNTITNVDGFFSFSNIPYGIYTFAAAAAGYVSQQALLEVSREGSGEHYDFQLIEE